jgi:hypothetical protein
MNDKVKQHQGRIGVGLVSAAGSLVFAVRGVVNLASAGFHLATGDTEAAGKSLIRAGGCAVGLAAIEIGSRIGVRIAGK